MKYNENLKANFFNDFLNILTSWQTNLQTLIILKIKFLNIFCILLLKYNSIKKE